ncbi:UNVERIFIED_CONTAM: hypothetical protein Slati_1496600 [Sesamum latifolium]|uniref:CCHC-type domain-containing protein n=1 Tax=Sesamum latifolium TaxID=2727402 RepID=A0AAW2X9C5_9LAMI
MADPQLKIHKFTRDLKSRIQSALAVFEARTFDELLGAAIRAEVDIRRRNEENNLKRPRPGQDQVKGAPNKDPAFLANRRPTLPPQPQSQLPECKICHKRHAGEYRWASGACFRCGQTGHRISECTMPDQNTTRAPTPRASTMKPNQRGNLPTGNAKAFAMIQEQADHTEDVVIGTIIINDLDAIPCLIVVRPIRLWLKNLQDF